MPYTPGGDPVVLNGDQWVPVVAAPNAGDARAVVSLLCFNRDTVAHAVELRKVKAGTPTAIHPAVTIGPGLKQQFCDSMIALDAANESLEMRSDATSTTTEPVVDVAWMETAL